MTQSKDWAARLDAVRDELAALAEQVRRLTAATVSVDAPHDVLERATGDVARIVADLERHVPTPHPPRYSGQSTSTEITDFFPYDPIVGRLSPLAPPLRVEWQGPRAIGLVRFGVPYEGPPGCVHGGIIAATFDQVFNVANLMRGVAGPTRRLEVRYLRPTPLLTELRFEGWVDRVEGREVHTNGRILNGGVVTVEAEGVFVQVSLERVMRLLDDVKQATARTTDAAPREQVEDPATTVAKVAPPAKDPSASARATAARRRRFRATGDGT